jgi:hypothetical protein
MRLTETKRRNMKEKEQVDVRLNGTRESAKALRSMLNVCCVGPLQNLISPGAPLAFDV